MRGLRHVVAVLFSAGLASTVWAQATIPAPSLIVNSPTSYFTQLGQLVRSQLPANATPKERADRVLAVMDSLAGKGHSYPVNKDLRGRLLSSTERGTCGWWSARLTEAFTAAGVPKASMVILESRVRDPLASSGIAADLADKAHDLVDVNNVHQSIAIVDGTGVLTYDVWQHGYDMPARTPTVAVGTISYGPEKGRIAPEWFARQVKDGRPLFTEEGVELAKGPFVSKIKDEALRIVNGMIVAGTLKLMPGVTSMQLDDWIRGQALLELVEKGLVNPSGLAGRVANGKLAVKATPPPSPAMNCWERPSASWEVSHVEPVGRGYAGTGSASAGSVSLQTHPADPKWSHLVTGGYFTWNLGGSRPVRLCPGDVLSGHATFSNNGTQLTRTSYSPSAALRIDLVNAKGGTLRAAALFELSSADLPAPGQTVTRPFRYSIPVGSAEVVELRIVAEVYAGRIARFTDVFRWVPK
jgi:hypothetical protein